MSSSDSKKTESFINAKAFVTAIIVIAVLMVLAYLVTLFIPCDGIPFWKWLLSPVLVLGSDDGVTIIGILVFLLVIGGVFNSLTSCGLMNYLIHKIAYTYADKKYTVLAVVTLFFMSLGSLIGSFEEVVPMVPIVVALAVELGWDAVTGLSISMLAAGCGFAAGVFNPFSVGVAQELAGLPMFSGAIYRAVNFVFIYILLLLFVRVHAKKIDTGINADSNAVEYAKDDKKDRGVLAFAIIMAVGFACILCSAVITVLRDYTSIIMALSFLVAGIVGTRLAGMNMREFGRTFAAGVISMLPAILMILMASSIKYTLQTAGILELLVDAMIDIASGYPAWVIVLFIYLIALIMNFVVSSGTAKAVMLMPLVVPLASAFGISAQVVVMAYAFGDGFSNIIYPTNPALLISLGLADISYGTWFKYSIKFQLLNLLLTSGLLILWFFAGI